MNIFNHFLLRWINLCFRVNVILLLVPSINHQGLSIDIFNKQLERVFDIIQKEKKYAFYIGDFNIDTKIESQTVSTLTEEFINLLTSYSYEKLITLPTREIGSSRTLIVNIYTNIPEPNLTGQSGVLNTIRTTDHYPIFTIRYNTHCKNTLSYRNRRNFNNDSISKLRKNTEKSQLE